MDVIGIYTGTPVQIAAKRGAGEAAVIVQAADGRIIGAAKL